MVIQYDRTNGLFDLQNETTSASGLEICAKLNEALAEIRSWLELKRRNGRYAHAFLAELPIQSMNRRFNIFAIYDEIGKLEGTDIVPSITKKPRQMRPPLRGLWHKHYFQPGYILRNLSDEMEQMVKDGRWNAILAPHFGKYIDECIGQMVHQMFMGAYEQRARDRRITGEFIVYEQQSDGSKYYLTLGRHGEWDFIRLRVDEYKRFDLEGDLSVT